MALSATRGEPCAIARLIDLRPGVYGTSGRRVRLRAGARICKNREAGLIAGSDRPVIGAREGARRRSSISMNPDPVACGLLGGGNQGFCARVVVVALIPFAAVGGGLIAAGNDRRRRSVGARRARGGGMSPTTSGARRDPRRGRGRTRPSLPVSDMGAKVERAMKRAESQGSAQGGHAEIERDAKARA